MPRPEEWFGLISISLIWLLFYVVVLKPKKNGTSMLDNLLTKSPMHKRLWMKLSIIVGYWAVTPFFFYGILRWLDFWEERGTQEAFGVGAVSVIVVGLTQLKYLTKLIATGDLFAIGAFEQDDYLTVHHIHVASGGKRSGYIRDVGIRSSHFKDGDGDDFYIPNDLLVEAEITNHTQTPWRVHTVRLPLTVNISDLATWAGEALSIVEGIYDPKTGVEIEKPLANTYTISPTQFTDEEEEDFKEGLPEEADKAGEWDRVRHCQIMYQMEHDGLVMLISAPVRTIQDGRRFESELLVHLMKLPIHRGKQTIVPLPQLHTPSQVGGR